MPVLSGLRVIELGGIGPGPHAAMMLADLGADVVRVERPVPGLAVVAPEEDFLLRNRRSVPADVKTDAGRDLVVAMAERADVFLEGFRPGVVERLGIGPDDCLSRNKRLVYGRMTGWGQDGPLAQRAGHDINYLALSGTLHVLARDGAKPFPPLNLVGDLGGGSVFLVLGVLAALFERERTGCGQVVDAAVVDGVSTLMAMYWTLTQQGVWSSVAGTNVTDGAAPFYNTYECADGGYVAVGAFEAPFYGHLLSGLGLDPATLPHQMDRDSWPSLIQIFTAEFRKKSRDEWTALFEGTDACVTPVLSLDEAARHPHIVARGTITSSNGCRQPRPAPRFSRNDPPPMRPPRPPGADLDDVIDDWGIAWEPQRDSGEGETRVR